MRMYVAQKLVVNNFWNVFWFEVKVVYRFWMCAHTHKHQIRGLKQKHSHPCYIHKHTIFKSIQFSARKCYFVYYENGNAFQHPEVLTNIALFCVWLIGDNFPCSNRESRSNPRKRARLRSFLLVFCVNTEETWDGYEGEDNAPECLKRINVRDLQVNMSLKSVLKLIFIMKLMESHFSTCSATVLLHQSFLCSFEICFYFCINKCCSLMLLLMMLLLLLLLTGFFPESLNLTQ